MIFIKVHVRRVSYSKHIDHLSLNFYNTPPLSTSYTITNDSTSNRQRRIALSTVFLLGATDWRSILTASDTDNLEKSVDDTSNTFSGASTGGDRVGVLVPGSWAFLEPDLGEDSSGGHGSGILCLGKGESKTNSVHVWNITVVLGRD